MKILSLFDGMACGYLAMIATGVHVDSYHAYEIDNYAIQTAQHNFPDIVECGDVFNADFTIYKGYDYLVGGSPCTYWSIAQSPDKRETTASGMGWELFSQYVRALKEAKPKYFIYENNKSMARDIYKSISETFGFEPIMINSALVSAQNRCRYYWVGRRTADGRYEKVSIEQPEDRGILLKDIVHAGENISGDSKSYCMTASYDGAIPSNTIERKQRTMIAESIGTAQRGRDDGQHYEAREDGKANALTTVNKDTLVSEPIRVFNMPNENGVQTQYQGTRVYNEWGKSITLKANGGGLGAKTGLYAMRIKEATKLGYVDIEPNTCVDLGQENSKTRRGRKMTDKSNCLTTTSDFYVYIGNVKHNVYEVKDGYIEIKGKRYPIKLKDGQYIIRKLTVEECKALQTVPEWYDFSCVSKTQAYKMLGNGWTIEVIAHLIRATLENEGKFDEYGQMMF